MVDAPAPTFDWQATSSSRRLPNFSVKPRLIALALLTLVAGWLRFTATSFGLPDRFRPDEEYMVSRALGFDKDWNPHFAVYPAAQMYVQHAALISYAHIIGTRTSFRDAYATDNQALAYLVARRVSAAFGTALVPAIYLAGAAAFGSGAALAAAAIVAVSTIIVRESKYATTDAAAAFWVTLAIAMLLRILRRGRYPDYAGAGLFSGLATATKYPAGAIIFAVVAAHIGASHREGRSLLKTIGDPRAYVAAGIALATFFCATPYAILDWRQTVADYAYQEGFVANGVGNPAAVHGWSWLLLHAMPDSFGVALQSLLLVSLLWAVYRRKRGTLSILTFAGVALLGMMSSKYVFYRYLAIPLPGLALLAGVFIGDMTALASPVIGSRRAAGTAILLLGLVLAPSLVRDLQLNHLLIRTDTRTLARLWIEAHAPADSAIAATDSTTPYGKPQLSGVYRIVPFDEPQSLRQKQITWVMSDSFPPLSFYSQGPSDEQLAVLNSQATLLFDSDPIIYGAPAPVFDANDAFYVPLRNISSVGRPGPRIRIWKLK
jgi:dolichyl-phosphate-mannose-protein mannosyltransferase